MITFTGAKLILKNRILDDAFLQVEDGKIKRYGKLRDLVPARGEFIDVQGKYIAPGLIDIHTHGAGGHDYMDGTEDAVVAASRMHLKHGTTTIVPTTLASSDNDLFKAIDSFNAARKIKENMPCLAGLHIEGPYFNPRQKGAQSDCFLRNPVPDHYMRIADYAGGSILRWSAAPELPGALRMGDDLAAMGIRMSIAHSNATYADVLEAFEHGYRQVTHLYSGMSTITRREGFRVLGVIESAYLIDGLAVEIIADGIHLPPELLRLIVRCKNNDDICLVTDSMRAAGLSEGKSILGSLKAGQEVIVENGIAKMPDRSCFAGSVATADRLIRVMTEQAGLDLVNAVRMMSLNPAKIIGLGEKKGNIESGKDADLVIFNENIKIDSVYLCGQRADL